MRQEVADGVVVGGVHLVHKAPPEVIVYADEATHPLHHQPRGGDVGGHHQAVQGALCDVAGRHQPGEPLPEPVRRAPAWPACQLVHIFRLSPNTGRKPARQNARQHGRAAIALLA